MHLSRSKHFLLFLITVLALSILAASPARMVKAAVPAAPSNLQAVDVSSNYITLTWSDNSSDEQTFIMQRMGPGDALWIDYHDLGPNVTSFTDPSLVSGQTYKYRIYARNADGSSGFSNECQAVTLSIWGVVGQPTGLYADNVTGAALDLHWTDNCSNENGYTIERMVEGDAAGFRVVQNLPSDSVVFHDNGLTPNTVYIYRVHAVTPGGFIACDRDLRVVTLAVVVVAFIPAAPSGLLVSSASDSAITLTWIDNSNNETEFVLQRMAPGALAFSDYQYIAANLTSFTDTGSSGTGLLPGSSYSYRIAARNIDGISAFSNEVSGTTSAIALPPASYAVEMRFYIGHTDYLINESIATMDVAPRMLGGRTVLPIRYVTEPLGALLTWEEAAQKVTISYNGRIIELWVGNNQARVDGAWRAIDPNDPSVAPVVDPPGRTMMPLRFIAENMGMTVDWDEPLQQVTVTSVSS